MQKTQTNEYKVMNRRYRLPVSYQKLTGYINEYTCKNNVHHIDNNILSTIYLLDRLWKEREN